MIEMIRAGLTGAVSTGVMLTGAVALLCVGCGSSARESSYDSSRSVQEKTTPMRHKLHQKSAQLTDEMLGMEEESEDAPTTCPCQAGKGASQSSGETTSRKSENAEK